MSDDFSRAIDAMKLGTYSRARKLFERAALAGNGRAEVELGLIALHGFSMDIDVIAATEHFDRGARLGVAEAHYHLALLALSDPSPQLPRSFFEHFSEALNGNYVQAWAALGISLENAAAVSKAATLGDRLCKILVAPMKGAMSLNMDRLFADLEQRLANTPSLPEAGMGKSARTVDGVLSALQASYLIELARPNLQPALVRDPRTGVALRSPLRTNSATTIDAMNGNLTIRIIERVIAQCSGLNLLRAESLSILRYGVGEEYKPHRDYLHDPKLCGPGTPGQRVRTIFCYLNEPALGGETEFLHWNQRFTPKLGRAVIFDNVRDGAVDPDSVHAGLPVLAGEKWLATWWMRERNMRSW